MKRIFGILLALSFVHAQASTDIATIFDVTFTGNTLNIVTTVPNHQYPAAGLKFNTPGYTPTEGCTPSSNGYCLFSVSNTQPATITYTGAGNFDATLCLNGNGPVTCEKITHGAVNKPLSLYVTNTNLMGSASVDLCQIQSDGTLESCKEAATGANTFNNPNWIALNTLSTFAYVLNVGADIITVCPIQADGTFGNCIQDFLYPTRMSGAVVNPTGDTLFVTNHDAGTVDACSIQSNGMLGTCSDSGVGAMFNTPIGIILNKAGTIAYVANQDSMSNIVDVCNVSGGSFTHCEDSGGAFAEPTGLAFSPDETQVYVTNILYNPPYNAPSISLCPVDSSHHLNCSDSGWSYPIQDTDQPWDIVINADSSLAYISSISENVVQVCPVTTNGFTGCQDSGLGAIFNAPAGIALLK